MNKPIELTAGSGTSRPVTECQVCGCRDLVESLYLGGLPPVNTMPGIGSTPVEQASYPAGWLYCPECELVQLGLIVDPQVLFPPDYPYTSGTTRILHENFADLAEESGAMLGLARTDLVVDIGSNDGTLLSKFRERGYRVYGIEPTDAARLAVAAGIDTRSDFFTLDVAKSVRAQKGPARLVTAANCFAHIENVHAIVDGILAMLDDDGVFISENHYLIPLIDTLQYDTIYHEHLRYYSLTSLSNLLARHGLEVIHARPIPSHGGSIRVYAARRGTRPVNDSVAAMLAMEKARGPMVDQLAAFSRRVVMSKLDLMAMLRDIKARGERVYAISAPSRGSTLANYVGLDDGIIDCICEIKGSLKIGKYLPGTKIPVVEESVLFSDQPDYALLFAWHIADGLMPKLRQLGFKGKFIVPLPQPRIA